MITKAAITALLLTFATSLSLHADTVPSLLSYQGRVSDADGNLIGTAGAVNRSVTFRLYSAPSDGEVLYAETQTVTISAGEFSVLIGNGTGISGVPGPSSPATTPYKTLSDIVNAGSPSALYLGITVDDGNSSTVDAEISPRQQLVSGVFSLRAKVAESVASAAISSGMIGDGAVNTNQIHANAINSAKIADGAIGSADLGESSVTRDKIDTSSIGLWIPSGSNVYRSSGNVGIGTSNPTIPLNFANALGNKISLYGNNTSSNFGFGIQSNLLQLYTSASGSDIAFGHGSSTNFTEVMRVKGNGNVGIGTKSPAAKLEISGLKLNGTSGRNYFKDSEKTDGAGLRIGTVWGNYGTYAETGPGALGGAGGVTLQNNSLFVKTSGEVGIGTTAPKGRLSVREPTGTTASANDGTVLIEHGNAGGASSIVFRSARNAGSDYGYIQYQDDASIGGGGEKARLIIGTQNDNNDDIYLKPSGSVGIKTTDTSQGTVNIGGSLVSIGSRNGNVAYAKFSYSDARGGGATIDLYNSNHNNGWRQAVFNGDSNWDFSSDERLKKNIEDAEPVLDRVLKLQLRRFQWKDQSDDVAPEFGVIAQEVQPLFPDIVGETQLPDQPEPTLTVGYTTFGTIAIKAIQELKEQSDQEVEALQAQLDEKDAQIASLEARLAAIENALAASK